MHDATRAELPDVLAVGAWLKNAACRWTAGQVEMSPLHGDLGDARACEALETSVRALLGGARRPVAAIAHDLHPDFFSTRLAIALAADLGVPAIGVQHHHAHIAAVMAEHGIDEPVVGLALDGVGHGSDGQAWGGELLWVSDATWQRLGHLQRLGLPGGDVAAREPWRMAAAALHVLGRGEEIAARFGPRVGTAAAQGVRQLLARQLRSPPTSSAGRWFDAAAGALGLCLVQTHEAEAAMALEVHASRWLCSGRPPRPFNTPVADAAGVLALDALLAPLFDTPADRVDEAAAQFHLQFAAALAQWAAAAAARSGVRTVCLGGGCFFNAVLTDGVTRDLQARGLRVLRPRQHSCGDAGLALGQAWVAARQLRAVRSIAPTARHSESLSCA
jgi:hydrogenase maturation protein HypF